MAVLLVKAENNNSKKGAAQWVAGDIVRVYADDHEFGMSELPVAGKFYHVHIENISVEALTHYADPSVTSKRRWRMNGGGMTLMANAGGSLTLTVPELTPYLRNVG